MIFESFGGANSLANFNIDTKKNLPVELKARFPLSLYSIVIVGNKIQKVDAFFCLMSTLFSRKNCVPHDEMTADLTKRQIQFLFTQTESRNQTQPSTLLTFFPNQNGCDFFRPAYR